MQPKRSSFAIACLLFSCSLLLSPAPFESRAFSTQDAQVRQQDAQQSLVAANDRRYRQEGILWNACGFIPDASYEGATSQFGCEWRCSDGAVLYFVADRCMGAHGAEIELQKQLQRKEIESAEAAGGHHLVKFSEPIHIGLDETPKSRIHYAFIWIEENSVRGLYGPTAQHVIECYLAHHDKFLPRQLN